MGIKANVSPVCVKFDAQLQFSEVIFFIYYYLFMVLDDLHLCSNRIALFKWSL